MASAFTHQRRHSVRGPPRRAASDDPRGAHAAHRRLQSALLRLAESDVLPESGGVVRGLSRRCDARIVEQPQPGRSGRAVLQRARFYGAARHGDGRGDDGRGPPVGHRSSAGVGRVDGRRVEPRARIALRADRRPDGVLHDAHLVAVPPSDRAQDSAAPVMGRGRRRPGCVL